MNIPDAMRCQWIHAGLRCMCPAALSTSDFCLFHRNPSAIDVAGIVEWSQEADPSEYVARARAFVGGVESPQVVALRAQIAATQAARSRRQPGEDEQAA